MKFKVWCPERGRTVDDAAVFVTYNAYVAAELWAEKADQDSAEYEIVSEKDSPLVHVQDSDGNVTRWRLTGESVPEYHAAEVEGADDGA